MAGIWEKMSQFGGSLFGSTGDDGTFNRGKLEELMMNPLFNAGASMYDGRGFGPGFAQAQGLQQRDAQLEAFAAEQERQKKLQAMMEALMNPQQGGPQPAQGVNVAAMMNAPGLGAGAPQMGQFAMGPQSQASQMGQFGMGGQPPPFSEPQQAPVAQPQQAGPQAGGDPYMGMLKAYAMYGGPQERVAALEALFDPGTATPVPAQIQFNQKIKELGGPDWKWGNPFNKAQTQYAELKQQGRLEYNENLQRGKASADARIDFLSVYPAEARRADDMVSKLEQAVDMAKKTQTGMLGPATVLTDADLQNFRSILFDLGLDKIGAMEVPLTPVSDPDIRMIQSIMGSISNQPKANVASLSRALAAAKRLAGDLKIAERFYSDDRYDPIDHADVLYQMMMNAPHRKDGNSASAPDRHTP